MITRSEMELGKQQQYSTQRSEKKISLKHNVFVHSMALPSRLLKEMQTAGFTNKERLNVPILLQFNYRK